MRRVIFAISLATLTACAATTVEPTTEPTGAATPEAISQAPSPSPSAEQTYILSGHAIPHVSCWDDLVLYEGLEVRIRNEADELIAVGNVGKRDGDTLRWEVEVEVPAARFYVVEVGADTKDQTFTPEEIAEGELLLVADSSDCG